jgi:sigma-B regulation protein RsbU (phosphoserine phosphatase)
VHYTEKNDNYQDGPLMTQTLVVDDDPEFRDLCLAVKEADGEDTGFLFAHNDAEALSMLTTAEDLDITIVAIDRPEISGMELFRKLQGRGPRVPRIALTANNDLGLIRQAMNRGAADFLTKPVSGEDLLATIRKVYQQTEERRRAWLTEAQLSALRHEVELAGQLQRSIIPNRFPVYPSLDIAARVAPAKEMSGDFYDLFEIDRHRIGVVVADVTGKGVPAAFFMGVVHTLLRISALSGNSPAACLEQVNSMLCQHAVRGMYVSAVYAILDTENWQLEYANGGHPYPMLLRSDGQKVELLEEGAGVVLGVETGQAYSSCILPFTPGDTLLLCTDGITEAFNTEREQFSQERLIELLSKGVDDRAESTIDKVFAAVRQFADATRPSDDMTVLALKRS